MKSCLPNFIENTGKLFFAFIFATNFGLADLSANELKSGHDKAAQFLADLQRRSPDHDGAPLRSYEIRDLNGDGNVEVIETVNDFEEEFTGWLNDELGPAFNWTNVYGITNGKYVLKTCTFRTFVNEKKASYALWEQRLTKPSALSKDSQELIKADTQGKLLQKLRELQSRCPTH